MKSVARLEVSLINNPRSSVEIDLKGLVRIAKSGFGPQMTEADVRVHVLGGDFVHLLRVDKKEVGFAAYRRFEAGEGKNKEGSGQEREGTILYLAGIVVDGEHQGMGLFGLSLGNAIRENRPSYVALRTQNPVVYHRLLRSEHISAVYPNVSGELASPMIMQVAEIVAERLGMEGMDRHTFVERGTYGQSLYQNNPVSSNEAANDFFRSRLGIKVGRGDSVLLIGQVGGSETEKYGDFA